jgi:hypothetical protein
LPSTSGSVPELKFENRSNQPILIVDGEALIGAKQNRIVNISILVPAQSITPIPVSCVERGRWSYRRPDFGSADHVLYSKSRAQKAGHVSASLRASGRARADQGAIWSDIARKAERMSAESRSEAMDALFVKAQQDLQNLELRLQPEINEVGAAFALDGRIVGLDIGSFSGPNSSVSFTSSRTPWFRRRKGKKLRRTRKPERVFAYLERVLIPRRGTSGSYSAADEGALCGDVSRLYTRSLRSSHEAYREVSQVFDAAETWRRLSRKVYRSYGLDALDAGTRVHDGSIDINRWLQIVAATPVAQFPSIGLGQDARFEHPRISGGALVVGQTMIHCAAFDAEAWQ